MTQGLGFRVWGVGFQWSGEAWTLLPNPFGILWLYGENGGRMDKKMETTI